MFFSCQINLFWQWFKLLYIAAQCSNDVVVKHITNRYSNRICRKKTPNICQLYAIHIKSAFTEGEDLTNEHLCRTIVNVNLTVVLTDVNTYFLRYYTSFRSITLHKQWKMPKLLPSQVETTVKILSSQGCSRRFIQKKIKSDRISISLGAIQNVVRCKGVRRQF